MRPPVAIDMFSARRAVSIDGRMTVTTTADLQIRNDVVNELAWDSQVDARSIGVTVREGAVTLTGFIDAYAGKLAVERAAKRVRSVRAVANDVQVRLRFAHTDEDIARDTARLLERQASESNRVQAIVRQGHVSLTGTVTSLFDGTMAEDAIRHVSGVKSVTNRIEVVPSVLARDVQREIASALYRSAELDATNIDVSVHGREVLLTGTVGSWREREAAEQAASHVAGITSVDNRLGIRAAIPPYDHERL